MEKNNYEQFLVAWDLIVMILAGLSIFIGILILIIHKIRLSSLREYKEKYDYLNANDTKMIFYSIIAFAVGITLFINTVQSSTVSINYVWFLVRLFIALCFGTLVIYVSYLILKFAYPSTLEKKLKKWRYKPRVNPKTGNVMKLLSEEEEDVHLDEGMQAEENVFSVDYDVWVDEETGDVKIEKYPGHLQALKCNSCGFQTMKLVKEEILIAPTSLDEGEMLKNYKCSYCGAKRSRTVRIARLSQDEAHFKLPEEMHFKEEELINLVTVEIHTSNGKSKMFEFSSASQASEFLQEYNVGDDI
jgi:hypothetical protein